jgi:hypothetical protein
MPTLDASRMLRTLAELRSAPPAVFGADMHLFRLNPALSEPEMVAFGQARNITLPPDFREFLTSVGDGGAGPFYGIFPLGQADYNFGLRAWRELDGMVGDLSVPFPLDDEWNDLSGLPADELAGSEQSEYDRQMVAFEKTYYRTAVINGAIPICHEGCALRIYLVVTGAQAGFLWEDRRAEFAGIRPVRLADGSAATFGGWYEEWLNECLAAKHRG